MGRSKGRARAADAPAVEGAKAPAVALPRPPLTLSLVLRRPLAALSYVPRELAMFVAGGVAGAVAKTATAPLDRVRPAAAGAAAAAAGAPSRPPVDPLSLRR